MNQTIYKEFKQWVIDTCITKTNGRTIYTGDTAHAIFSAWYVYKHHLSEEETEKFLRQDAEKSKSHFIHYGYYVNFGGRYTMRTVEPSVYNARYEKIDKNLSESMWKTRLQREHDFEWVFSKSCTNHYIYFQADLQRCIECWILAVKVILNYWIEKEKRFNTQSSTEIFRKYVMCSDDPQHKKFNKHISDEKYLLWYALKHRLNEEDTKKWFIQEIEKRPKRLNQCYWFPCLEMDAYHFRNVLNINNDIFEIKSDMVPVLELSLCKEKTGRHLYYKSWLDKGERTKRHYYTIKEKYIKGAYIPFDIICKDKTRHSAALLGHNLKFKVRKDCTQDGIIKGRYKVHKGLTVKTYNIEPIEPSKIEPIMLTIQPLPYHAYNSETSLFIEEGKVKAKENYLMTMMDFWHFFKCLDDVEVLFNDISYNDFSKPIGSIQRVKLKFL